MEAPASADIRRIRVKLRRAAIVANVSGAFDTFLFLVFLLPTTVVDDDGWILVNAIVFAVVLPLSMYIGNLIGVRRLRRIESWLGAGRPPTVAERDDALRQPLYHTKVTAVLWGCAVVLFGALNAFAAPVIGVAVALTLTLGAVTTTSIFYLLCERILRPVTAAALHEHPPSAPVGPGVGARVTMIWAGACGMPIAGVVAVAVVAQIDGEVARGTLTGAVVFLAAVALFIGLLAMLLTARALAEPLAGLRRALASVEEGDFKVRVAVDDGSELGQLQVGFNRMVEGLEERERLQDLFGRHVGRDVAHAALDDGARLGGEVREVGVLVVDLVGSTAMASRLEPRRVVGLLNEFFALVVAVVEAHGGIVNKFEGDGALCVFGAPVALDDPAGAALAAARELRARLTDELPDLDAGVGVSAGQAVAGNVGAEERFEYTVIGDPVNEVSRLCEVAKRAPERLVASAAAVERAREPERSRWQLGESEWLRGREEPTVLATVAPPGSPESGEPPRAAGARPR